MAPEHEVESNVITYLVPSKAVSMRKIKYAGRLGLSAVPIEHAKNKNAVTRHIY